MPDLLQRDQLHGEHLESVTLDAILPGPAGKPEAALDVTDGPLLDDGHGVCRDLLEGDHGYPLHLVAASDRDAEAAPLDPVCTDPQFRRHCRSAFEGAFDRVHVGCSPA